ncbi:hypothetical protein P691DRAFT_722968 [Macrolepiota fuliginosa MF-IS2]|uniref:Uncharacterized protein n=1 Tax=Macrolepiota fuliginosa MF-IS2 TaxID=1400762 RepID=A0A9P5XJD1_9AGAR|nr:hypothetical protein P691DRAFT_722968 [Macrolepiota fuliginosa MF-IS2]
MSSNPGPLQGRRKGPKQLPRLPLSAFTPPNSGTSDKFPLPPSPSTVHPENVVDAHVVGDPKLERWQKEVSETLGKRAYGVVLAIPADKASEVVKETGGVNIISTMVPFSLGDPESISAAVQAASESSVPVSFSTVFSGSSPENIAGMREVLQKGRPVDIEIRTSIADASLEGFEEFLTKATTELEVVPPIILSNLLPPPHDFNLPIVKLMNHPTYNSFQAQTAALSLFPYAYVKYLPPVWGVATPSTPQPGAAMESSGAKEQREWKRRIKMYLGPVMEAFGFQRIIFGSSSPTVSQASSNSSDWYNVAREALAELGVEQEIIDSVFSLNAQKVYGSK